MKPATLIILLAALAGITLFRSHLIVESSVSFFGTIILLAGGGDAPGVDWDPSLTEFRIAAVVWAAAMIGLGVILIHTILYRKRTVSGSIPQKSSLVPMPTGISIVRSKVFTARIITSS